MHRTRCDVCARRGRLHGRSRLRAPCRADTCRIQGSAGMEGRATGGRRPARQLVGSVWRPGAQCARGADRYLQPDSQGRGGAHARSAGRHTRCPRRAVPTGQRQRCRAAHQPRNRFFHQRQRAVRREQQLQPGARGQLGDRPVGRHPAQRGGQRYRGAGQHGRRGRRTAFRAGAAGPGLPAAARRGCTDFAAPRHGHDL